MSVTFSVSWSWWIWERGEMARSTVLNGTSCREEGQAHQESLRELLLLPILSSFRLSQKTNEGLPHSPWLRQDSMHVSILSFLSSHRFIFFPTKHFKFSCGYDPWPQTLSQNPFNPPCSLWGIDKAKRIQWQILSGVSLIPWQFISSALTPCLWGSVPLNQQRHWDYVNKLHVIPKRFPSLGELVKHSFADTHTSFTPHIKTLAYLTHLLLSSSDIDKVDAWQLAVWEGFGWG